MDKIIKHEELIKKQSKTKIKKLIKACERLKWGYENLEGSDECPLCVATKTATRFWICKDCPWHTIRGLNEKGTSGACTTRRGEFICNVRFRPESFVQQAKYRIKELSWWIKVYKNELKNREG